MENYRGYVVEEQLGQSCILESFFCYSVENGLEERLFVILSYFCFIIEGECVLLF